MIVERLELHDFRNYANTSLQLHPDVTAILGDNGQGKTNLVEALAYLASLESFRGVSPEVLVRDGADQAVVRADIDERAKPFHEGTELALPALCWCGLATR